MRFFHSAVSEARDLVVFKIDSTIRSLEGGGWSGHPRRRTPPVRSREWYITPTSTPPPFSHVIDMDPRRTVRPRKPGRPLFRCRPLPL
jgi:hypothetical protein